MPCHRFWICQIASILKEIRLCGQFTLWDPYLSGNGDCFTFQDPRRAGHLILDDTESWPMSMIDALNVREESRQEHTRAQQVVHRI
jgi:hypothetical protein